MYAYALYQHRITMIRRRDPGPFGVSSVCYIIQSVGITVRFTDQIAGPVIISALLFFAVLANFIFRGALPFMHLNDLFRLICSRYLWCDGLQFANCMFLPLFLRAIPASI